MRKRKIYFAGKFHPEEGVPFDRMLLDDYRANMLGLDHDQRMMTSGEPTEFRDGFIYCGSFFLPSDVDVADTRTIVANDLSSLEASDVVIAVLYEEPSIGTTSELVSAAEKGKDIFIIHPYQETRYKLKSEYWFAITLSSIFCERNKRHFKAVQVDKLTNRVIDSEIQGFLREMESWED